MSRRAKQDGFALVAALSMMVVLSALLGAYFVITRTELSSVAASRDATTGYYAAEAGLNLRADGIRKVFVGFNQPAGTSTTDDCNQSLGGGDFACVVFDDFQGRDVQTYVVEPPGNPVLGTIPGGETFGNLSVQEYRYDLTSAATNARGETEALLRMRFKSRLVPLFQFAAFYDGDLEILPAPAMELNGPVHTNGDLYLDAETSLDLRGQVSAGGNLYRGRKNDGSCERQPVRVADPDQQVELPACELGRRRLITRAELGPWNDSVRTNMRAVTVPGPDELEPAPGRLYWDRADLRLALNLKVVPPRVEVRLADGMVDLALTDALNISCADPTTGLAPAWSSGSFFNNRENLTRGTSEATTMLELDVGRLMACAQDRGLFGPGKGLDDTTDGGLVWHLSVDGPSSNSVNSYGVRLRNAARLGLEGGPAVAGLTVVTDQAAYLLGDYNRDENDDYKVPAAVMADSLNILSNAWQDVGRGQMPAAAVTVVNAAFLAGTDRTGGTDGEAGRDGPDGGDYNGGLENYPRLHENWNRVTLTYRGSFVSLFAPRRASGLWENQTYKPPVRDWSYDESFNVARNLPPLTPRFVTLKQELFTRQFDR